MAKKAKTVFVCQECGYESPKWMGQCICGAWNSMFEEKLSDSAEDDKRRRTGMRSNAKPAILSAITAQNEHERIDTGISELNRVLGGGLVPGSLTLISGEPGIGKSTIIMQAAANIAASKGRVLYVSGEESEEQIKMRADRICKDMSENLYILAETNMENIAVQAEHLKPQFVIIDSIQTMYTEDLDSAPGSVSQVRACGNELMRIGKMKNVPIFIVAHVTKSGDLAGPKIVEHLVDCVLNFSGERNQELRILRAFKNRFGTTSEIGAFEMAQEGLIEIKDLSRRFLEDMDDENEGSVVTAVYEGTRPLLLEIQALTSKTAAGFPRRTALGIENGRLSMIIAVLERRTGISLADQDVYVNIVGGLKPEGTSTDLAVALALYSTFTGINIRKDTLALGEVGLTGDLRPVRNVEKIIKEAGRMGMRKVILPGSQAVKLLREQKDLCKGDSAGSFIEISGAKNLREAIAACSE
ncbi:MAG: DNA repair protein RadA [Anaerovoracaceae bacterium]|nr:DNA repair protein RadA [Anaerovoracaceae bacterium]